MCKDKIPHEIDGGFYRYKSRGLMGHKRGKKGHKRGKKGHKGEWKGEKGRMLLQSPPLGRRGLLAAFFHLSF
jgi:hypothetical protein